MFEVSKNGTDGMTAPHGSTPHPLFLSTYHCIFHNSDNISQCCVPDEEYLLMARGPQTGE